MKRALGVLATESRTLTQQREHFRKRLPASHPSRRLDIEKKGTETLKVFAYYTTQINTWTPAPCNSSRLSPPQNSNGGLSIVHRCNLLVDAARGSKW